MNDEANITRINMVLPMLNEDQKRMYFASEASAIDRGGITCISNLTGVSRVTITAGIKDLKGGKTILFQGMAKYGSGEKVVGASH